MYTRKAAKKFYFYIFFYHEEISGVVGRKSEQCLAQEESFWYAIGQQESSNKKSPALPLKPHWSFSLKFFGLELRTLSEDSRMSKSSANKSQSSVAEAFHKWEIRKKKKNLPLSNYGTHKALRVLIVQSPQTINLF